MAKILIADDEADFEALIRQKFRQKIRENLYEFVFAANGEEALEKIKSNPDIDIVLSDINMPGMDGLTLLSHLSESNPLIKSVIVSAYGDMDNIRVAMNRGAFDFVTKPINFEDLSLTMERTIDHVRHIRETLKAVKENNILKMYVDETVLNFMGGKEFENQLMENENVQATVIFIDICGFTSISEHESPDAVVRLLNTYFDVMVKEIINQNGIIDKFIGDAIMAVFKGEQHLQRAVQAALLVRQRINELPAVLEHITFKPNLSIGINSGDMISGNIGSASLRWLDYTVIGDTVNTAQRLQSIAMPGQILLSQETMEQLGQTFTCHQVGEVNLKDKTRVVHVYEVLG